MNPLCLDTKVDTRSEDFFLEPNLTGRLNREDKEKVSSLVWDGYTRDKLSRFKWEKRMEAGMDLAMQIQTEKNFPWPGAANVIFPLVTIASLQFSTRSYANLIQGTDIVRYRVVGNDPNGSNTQRADRISKHMSWQVLEEDTAWEEQHDRLLINLGIVGTNFIKEYYSSKVGHNVSELVMARDLVVDYWAKSIESAARKSHLVPMARNEMYESVGRGIFEDILDEAWFTAIPNAPDTTQKQDNRQGSIPGNPDEDTPFVTIEQHRNLDLDQDGYAEPYIATIEVSSKKLLRLVARWDRKEDVEVQGGKILRIKPTEYFTKYGFIPAADGGIYDTGFGVLLGPLNEAVNSGINQLLDAGTMSNSSGGFLGRGAKIRGGNYTVVPWEWKRVDSTGDDLRKSMVPFPTKEPSTVMFQLLGLIIQYVDRISGTTEEMTGKSPGQNTPAETSRNSMEAGMQVYSSIQKRIWRSLKEEFKKLHRLNAIFMPQKQTFGSAAGFALREDYQSDPDQVVPVADPNITSKSMRVQIAAAVREAAHSVPGYNIEAVERQYLRALGVENIDVVYPGPDKTQPLPNPKMQLEEMKLKSKEMGFQFRMKEVQMKLQSEQRLTQAKIGLLQAQMFKLESDANVDHAEVKMKAFQTAIAAMESHNNMLSQSIESLGKAGELSDQSGNADKEGMGGLEGSANDTGGVSPAAK